MRASQKAHKLGSNTEIRKPADGDPKEESQKHLLERETKRSYSGPLDSILANMIADCKVLASNPLVHSKKTQPAFKIFS